MSDQRTDAPPESDALDLVKGHRNGPGRTAGSGLSGERPQARLIETADGTLRGAVANGLAVFKGIRYGESTAGQNRFLPPKKPKAWAGVRDATELGHPCVQTNEDFPVWLDPIPESEDCLFLNVWSPESAIPTAKLPVMVWIHGGGYTFGSGGAPLYDCGTIAATGNVVCVSLNHRLQAFGFTDLSAAGGEPFAGSGNAGLLDIVAALEWVRNNIEAFGGDPGNITVFGQSGGGAKISSLMAMPIASGLFHRAIVQSGSVFRYRSPGEAEAMSNRMFSILGIASNDISTLQRVPADVLLRCGNQIMSEASGTGHSALKYAPVVDGTVIPVEPWWAGAPEGANNISMIVGSTIDETVVYLPVGELDEASVSEAIVKAAILYTPDRARVSELIPAYRRAFPGMSNRELVVRMSTDIGFWKNAIRHAEMQSKSGAPVYMYRCDWKTPCCGGLWGPHGVELPLVMGHKRYGAAWDGTDSETARDAADPAHVRFDLGDRMLAAWVNFARNGDPSSPDLPWPQYDLRTRSTFIFDGCTAVVDDPSGSFRTLVSSV